MCNGASAMAVSGGQPSGEKVWELRDQWNAARIRSSSSTASLNETVLPKLCGHVVTSHCPDEKVASEFDTSDPQHRG